MSAYRIVLADDHALLREGIKGIINESKHLTVVGEASDGMALLTLLKRVHADMVVLDVSMPRLRGIEAAREIKQQYPGMKILFLSMYKKKEYLSLALRTGAEGYLLKEDTGFELIRAIDTIREGRTYLSPTLLKEAPEDLIGIIRGNRSHGEDPLTTREREVLKLVGEGKTSKEIADLLFISPYTVSNHRKNIKKKLHIRKNADLIKYAIQQGYATSTDLI
jgi:DNA-binding NarL/FixJ family response regulator